MAKHLIFAVAVLANLLFAIDLPAQLKVSPGLQGFSAIKGTESRVGTVSLVNNSKSPGVWSFSILGDHAGFFSLQSKTTQAIDPGESVGVKIVFTPPSDFVGIATATLRMVAKETTNVGQSSIDATLKGLSTKGLEGKNEAPLADVLATLGLGTDVGWKTLGNHCKPELQGEEISPTLFRKAGEGLVEIIPLARYSPSFRLPFGYYNGDGDLHQVGVLSAKKQPFPEHQTLHPALAEGSTEFDPGDQPLGIYTSSPTHDAFSKDELNRKLNETSTKQNAVHACRTYPARTNDGKLLKNQYLFCFEEAFNGDYQDYVFLVRNIEPITDSGE